MNNIDKILQYLQLVSKDPIIVDDQIYDRCLKIHRIQLSSTFFLTDGCNSCGCCDVPEDNVYVQFEYDRIMNITEPEYHSYNKLLDMNQLERLRTGLKQEMHNINLKNVPVYVFKLEKQNVFLSQKGRVVERCTWSFSPDRENPQEPTDAFTMYYCHIHPVTSITCKMPHLRFMNNSRSDVCRIGIYQFGRNWATKCPIIFKEPENEREFNANKKNRLDKLEYLDRVAHELNIDTYLPEIIDYVSKISYHSYENYLEVDIINKVSKPHKLF